VRPFSRSVPERWPPRWPEDFGSFVEVRDAVFDSPERARSLLTVRAAISFARPLEAPRFSALSFTCSYWRARLVPFFTPAGGIYGLLVVASLWPGATR
jgi:hypothetical protein